jgi:hypothetical protein
MAETSVEENPRWVRFHRIFVYTEEEEEEEEEYFIDQLRTHKGHSNYNDWQYGIQTYNVHNNNKEINIDNFI